MDTFLWPIKVVVAWIMYGIHRVLLFLGMSEGSGWAWVFSIVGLVIVIRILILPLFAKQLRSSRAMQLVQPQVRAVQKKYEGKKDTVSRQRMAEEIQAVYREAGTSPFASCLPALVQIPIFFSLFRVLNSLAALAEGSYTLRGNPKDSIGPITARVAEEIQNSAIFGAPLWATLRDAALTDSPWATRIVGGVLVILMAASQYLSMKFLMSFNMAPQEDTGAPNPMMQTQKLMMYLFPAMMLISGVMFPIGTVVYWFGSNVWAVGQQIYMVRNQPVPNSPAWEAKKERDRKKRIRKGLPPEPPQEVEEILEEMPRGQRVQPSRRKGKKGPRTAEEIAAANLKRRQELIEEAKARKEAQIEAEKEARRRRRAKALGRAGDSATDSTSRAGDDDASDDDAPAGASSRGSSAAVDEAEQRRAAKRARRKKGGKKRK